jgi:hypothetical protein
MICHLIFLIFSIESWGLAKSHLLSFLSGDLKVISLQNIVMGSIIYDFFSESMLSHASSINSEFQNESLVRLEKELLAYRDFCIDNFDEIIGEIVDNNSTLKTFTSIDTIPIKLLAQTALYLDQFIIPDPLFKLTETRHKNTLSISKYLGFQESKLDKKQLSKSCSYLNTIVPMVEGNFVKLFPISYYFERPTIPFYGPEHFFKDILPPHILDFFRKNAIVLPMSKLSSGGWAIFNKELKPCRAISVEFKDSNKLGGMVYFLFESEVISVDKIKGTIQTRETLPENPPDDAEFQHWVDQSIRSVSKKYFDEVFLETKMAGQLNATYLTDNTFTSKLIDTSLNPESSIQTFTTNQIINIELPFLEKIDVEKLMQVRNNDADIFTSFRLELEKNFRELRSIQDDQLLKEKVENVFHELNDVQGQKIKRKIDSIKKQAAINSAVATGGLVASFATNGISLLGTFLAMAKGYKDYLDYKEKVTENPAYLLWKVKK